LGAGGREQDLRSTYWGGAKRPAISPGALPTPGGKKTGSPVKQGRKIAQSLAGVRPPKVI